jgi:hypothetical protein
MRSSLACALAAAGAVVVTGAAGCGTGPGPAQCPSTLRAPGRSDFHPIMLPAANRIYVLGGQGSTQTFHDLWVWSFGACGGWTQLPTSSSPGPITGYAAALDTMRNRILYVGGQETNDVWSFDTDLATFTQLAPAGVAPVVAPAELVAYDDLHDRLVYVGLESQTLEFSNTDLGQWQYLSQDALTPPADATVDPTRALLLVLDGAGLRGFHFISQTWEPAPLTVSGDVPPAGARLAWDLNRGRLIAFADGVYTAMLDGNGTAATFARLTTSNDPPARSAPGIAISGDLLWLFGGRGRGCVFDDVWTMDLNSGAWQNVWPATTCQ